MEPNKLSYNAELPEPMAEGGDVLTVPTPEVAQSQNQVPVQPAQPMSPPVSPPAGAMPVPVQMSPAPAPTTQTALIADDADLIEKEWVLKAKAIVAQTAHDPGLLTKEIGKVKADYLKKRYNKTLKVDES